MDSDHVTIRFTIQLHAEDIIQHQSLGPPEAIIVINHESLKAQRN